MSEKRMKFCPECGCQLASEQAKFCSNCGFKRSSIIPEKVSNLWYLIPLVLGILGGLLAWFINKDANPKKAMNFLMFGAIWSIIIFSLVFAGYIYLFWR